MKKLNKEIEERKNGSVDIDRRLVLAGEQSSHTERPSDRSERRVRTCEVHLGRKPAKAILLV